jgi:Lrp/AsnC family leucine-responsive transcriptional regulator
LETLDKFDIAILRELQADGRLTNAELSTRVGLSAAPCWRRVRALEEGGYIKGYRAEIDRHKIGLGVLAFVRLDADRNNGDVTRQLEEAIRAIPEVISCHYISGTGTFELQVVSRDLNSFSQFAREVLINLPNVKDLHTSFLAGRGERPAARCRWDSSDEPPECGYEVTKIVRTNEVLSGIVFYMKRESALFPLLQEYAFAQYTDESTESGTQSMRLHHFFHSRSSP